MKELDFIKVFIQINPYEQWISDSLTYQLGNLGFEGFIETGTGLEAYIPEKDFREQPLEALFSAQPDTVEISWHKEYMKEQNWNEEWERNNFKPLVVQDQCVIRAPFHSGFPPCKYEIIIEPNMTFGTGSHETTRMMIEFLLNEDLHRQKVLDMGCGTGILAILASLRGATEVTAIDTEERACRTTIINAGLNQIANLKILEGDASLLDGMHLDLILANIHRNVLLADMDKYVAALQPGGKLAMSGFYSPDLPAIKEKTRKLKLKDTGFHEKNNWILYTCQKTS